MLIIPATIMGLISCQSDPMPDNPAHDPSCQNKEKEESVYSDIPEIMMMEHAHAKEQFLEKDSISFRIDLQFGGRDLLNGNIVWATNTSGGQIIKDDGEVITVDGNQVTSSNPDAKPESLRFAAYTWSYFFLLPYKLCDPGTVWEKTTINAYGEPYNMQLTFQDGTGDAPDDWYIIHATPDHLIQEAAYIVTAGQSVEEAEEDPHSIQYSDYQNIAGVPIATSWSFWAWNKEEGATEQLGKATLGDLKFK
ncbi:MAG: hypothetical protein AAF193_03570 [Bacteroidota bacterium]